jgi:hypothetical protein
MSNTLKDLSRELDGLREDLETLIQLKRMTVITAVMYTMLNKSQRNLLSKRLKEIYPEQAT